MSAKFFRAAAALLATAALAGCSNENPVQPQTPPAVPTLTPAAAIPSPTPTPEPARNENHPPTVTVHGGGSCHPTVNEPCTIDFEVEARDRDGDRFRIEWSGCTSGTATRATCFVPRPGDHSAVVTVTDVHGARTRVAGLARGTNLPPAVRIGGPRPPAVAPANTSYSIVGAEPHDPDDYTEQNSACPHLRIAATGPCRVSANAVCGGVGDVFDFDIRTLAGPGTCVVEATVTDPWGLVGRDTLTFQVAAP